MNETDNKGDRPGARRHEVFDYLLDETTTGETMLPVEEPVELWVGDFHLATLHCTPEYLDDLARGFLLGQGLVTSGKDITTVTQRPEMKRIDISLREGIEPATNGPPANRIIYSGCGQPAIAATGKLDHHEADAAAPAIVTTGILRDALERVLRQGELYRQTRGIHSAGLFSIDGRELVFREDIGRHNAGDKVLGWLSRQDLDPGAVFLATSGRSSAEAVNKAVRFGIPILFSKGVPTSLAVADARRLGLTIGSSLGPGRLRLYSHRYRVKK
jgi:FdhD protein